MSGYDEFLPRWMTESGKDDGLPEWEDDFSRRMMKWEGRKEDFIYGL